MLFPTCTQSILARLAPVAFVLTALVAGCDYRDEQIACTSDDQCKDWGAVCDRLKGVCATLSDASLDAAATDAPAPSDTADGGVDAARNDATTVDSGPDASLDVRRDAGGTCGVKSDCTDPSRTFCGPANTCVECLGASDCKDGSKPFCVANACVNCTVAGPNACTGNKPVCDTGTKACVECTASSDCKDPSKPICSNLSCQPCTTDAQCAARNGANPGVCLTHQGGRCATDAETIYVQKTGTCVNNGTGTAAAPFCRPQDALGAITANRRVVVLRGGAALEPFSFAVSGGLVSLIGQNAARVSPGASVGIQISAGELYMRHVQVSGGEDLGVVVQNGATLRMNGCLIERNRGGLYVNGGSYEIVNSIFARNEPAPIEPASLTTFGGVFLNGVVGKPQLFNHNTIASNRAAGLYCTTNIPVRSLLFTDNGVDVINCAVSSSKAGVDPKFDPARPYHLTSQSPCLNAGDPTVFPSDDIDGEARAAVNDCGADELRQ